MSPEEQDISVGPNQEQKLGVVRERRTAGLAQPFLRSNIGSGYAIRLVQSGVHD